MLKVQPRPLLVLASFVILLLLCLSCQAVKPSVERDSSRALAFDPRHVSFTLSLDRTPERVERLLTQLRTTFRFHDAEVGHLPARTMVKVRLAESFFSSPTKPRFLNLGFIRPSAQSDVRGFAIALPMTTLQPVYHPNVRGFALFSVYPDRANPVGTNLNSVKPHILFHGYVHLQNIGTFPPRVRRPPRLEHSPLLPGDLVSLEEIYREVLHGDH